MSGWNDTLMEAVTLGRQVAPHGQVAQYIPELAAVNPLQVGIAAVSPDGALCSAGEADVQFTMQSVSKVLTLTLALMAVGEEAVFARVGMEATGDPFNSIIRLETVPERKPLNPFINAGAIAIADLIPGDTLEDRMAHFLRFVRKLAGNETIGLNHKVAESEWATGHRNRALAYFLMDAGILNGGVEETLRFYFMHCSVEVTCQDLARIAARYAYPDGLIPRRVLRIVNAYMTTCGLYNGSGQFAIRIGMAAKSGVGGGILAVSPGRGAVATFGPALDLHGNSVAGMRMLEHVSDAIGLSVFDAAEGIGVQRS
jgi:glutaminase